MDKVREEFEKCWKANDGNNYPFDKKRLCYLLYKSRDEEIKKLRDILEEVGNILYDDSNGIGDLVSARRIIEKALKDDE